MLHGFGIVGIPKRGGGPLVKPAPGAIIDPQHPLAQGLMAFWLCDTLGTVRSATGIGHGTPTSGVAVASGRGGPALDFDGEGRRVEGIGDPWGINSETSQGITLVALIKTNVIPSNESSGANQWYRFGAIMGAGYLDTTIGYGLYITSENYGVSVRRTSISRNITSAHGGETGVWRHLVGTRTSTHTRLYLDSVEIGTNSDGAISGGTVPARRWGLGQADFTTLWAHVYRGLIEHASFYSRALNPTEIAKLHAEPYCMMWLPGARRIFIPVEAGGPTGIEASLTSTLAVPSLTASASLQVTAEQSSTLPVPTLTATAQVTVTASQSSTLPVPTLNATASLSIGATFSNTTPVPALSASASVQVTASLASTLAVPALTATVITVYPTRELTLTSTLAVPGLTATASLTVNASLSGTLPVPGLVATIDNGAEIELLDILHVWRSQPRARRWQTPARSRIWNVLR